MELRVLLVRVVVRLIVGPNKQWEQNRHRWWQSRGHCRGPAEEYYHCCLGGQRELYQHSSLVSVRDVGGLVGVMMGIRWQQSNLGEIVRDIRVQIHWCGKRRRVVVLV